MSNNIEHLRVRVAAEHSSLFLTPATRLESANVRPRRGQVVLAASRRRGGLCGARSAGLPVEPGLVLVDGHLRIPASPWPQRAVVRGDRRCASIAAASILAKVARDAFMIRVDRRYPDYGFRQHKGYATAAHLEALARLGPCPLHRRSFRGVLPRSGSTPQDDAGPRLWP